jgi:hypothetical protein
VTGLGVRTIRRHVAAGALQTTRVGGRVYVTPQDGRAWWGRDLPIGNLEPSPAWRVVPIRVYAAITGMTARQVRHLVDKGALRTRKIGGRIFVEHSELVAALDNSATHNR